MFSKSKFFFAIVTVAFLGAIAVQRADASYYLIANNSPTGGPDQGGNINGGTQFTVGSNNLTVTALGVWGGNGPNGTVTLAPVAQTTLPGNVTAYLYDDSSGSPVQIASVTVQAGTSATDASTISGSGFAFANLSSPVTLTSGKTYSVTDQDQSYDGYVRLATSSLTTGPGITLSSTAVFGVGSGASAPTSSGGSPILGGNFIYTAVPEPAALGLVSVASLGLLARRRRAIGL